jgi:LPS export ABC transporter protein LptC
MIYRIFAVFIFLAVTVGSVLLGNQQREVTSPTTFEEPLRDPGYAARRAKLVETGEDGLPLYTLDADQIRQQPNTDTVELEQVQMGFRDPNGNHWTARANHGVLGQNSGKVELSGDVHVAGVLPGTEQPAEITTERLWCDTRGQLVSTRDPVTLAWSGHRLNGRGLLASLKDRRLQLESAVHGILTP